MTGWKVRFRKWDIFLHALLTAVANAEVESSVPFKQALEVQLNCDADLRGHAKELPKFILQIIRFSLPKKARATARKFVLQVAKH